MQDIIRELKQRVEKLEVRVIELSERLVELEKINSIIQDKVLNVERREKRRK